MAKFASILLIVGVFISVQALPPTYDEILAAAQEDQLEKLQQLVRSNLAKNVDLKNQPLVFDGVRNLKPVEGGHVYGEAEYSFHSASNIGGKTTEDHAGHKVINDDGKVKEFDFTPKTDVLPALPGFKPPSQSVNDYSASDYSFQYAPSADKPGDFIQQPALAPKLPIPDQYFVNLPNQEVKPGSQNLYNHQYSFTHSHSYVDGKPVEGGLIKNAKPVITPISFDNIKNLKPTQGGQVFGEAQYSFHTATNVDGKVSETKGGHKIINNNGQIQEFDLTPVPKSQRSY